MVRTGTEPGLRSGSPQPPPSHHFPVVLCYPRANAWLPSLPSPRAFNHVTEMAQRSLASGGSATVRGSSHGEIQALDDMSAAECVAQPSKTATCILGSFTVMCVMGLPAVPFFLGGWALSDSITAEEWDVVGT